MSTSCQVGRGPHVRAVGWLSADHEFTRGPMDPAFFAILRQHVKGAWQPVVAAGPHFCEFCPSRLSAGGAYNVWIPSEHHLFIAPELILHYIEAHQYQPPAPFIEAVLACPVQHSDTFFTRMQPFWEDRFGEFPLRPGK